MRPVGVALVGTGLAGGMHADGLRLLPQARCLGAVGSSPAKGAAFATARGLPRAYRDLDEMLADSDVAVVHLCTPPHTHPELAARVAAAGKHVLIDKPIARTVAEAEAVIAVCASHSVLLGGLFQNRFTPEARSIREAVVRGDLGEIHLADCRVKWWRDDAYYAASSWRARHATEGGGALINQAIHSIDLLQWLAGPVSEVSGRVAAVAHAIETEDLGVAVLVLRGGHGLGVLEGTTAAHPGFPARLELHGRRGSVLMGEDRTVRWHLRGEAPRVERFGPQLGNASDPAAVAPEEHAAAFADFLAAVAEGRRPAVDGREAAKALAIVEAIYRSSAAGGSPVRPAL